MNAPFIQPVALTLLLACTTLHLHAASIERWTVAEPAAAYGGPNLHGIDADAANGIHLLYDAHPSSYLSRLLEASLRSGHPNWDNWILREQGPALRWKAVDLAVDQHVVRVLARETVSGRHFLRYLPGTAGDPISTVTEVADDTYAFLRSDAAGHPLVYLKAGHSLRLATLQQNNQWQLIHLWSGPEAESELLSLQRDATGRTHLLYTDWTAGGRVYYAGQTDSGWVEEAVSPPGVTGSWTGSLALDSLNRPHIVFARRYQETHYAIGWRDPVRGWQFEDGINMTATIAHLRLAFDRFDHPIILEVPGSGDYTMARRRRDDGSWHTLVIEDARAFPCVFRLDRVDRPLLAYARYDVIHCSRVSFNRSPVLTSGTTLPAVTAGHPMASYSGTRVEHLLATLATDADGNAWGQLGLAVGAPATNGGWWEYSLDEGATWTDLRYLRELAEMGAPNMAALIPHYGRLRFLPNGTATGTLPLSLPFRAWDRYIGAPGQTLELPDARCDGISGFSANLRYLGVTILPFTNSAPEMPEIDSAILLDPVAMNALPAENAGTSVADIPRRAHATDSDGDPLGIAVIGASHDQGSWQYQRLGQGSWTLLNASDTSACLLQPADRIRLDPKPGYEGRAHQLAFRAWDQTSAQVDSRQNGGQTAFSSGANVLAIDVIPANRAPVLTNTAPVQYVAYYNRILPDDNAPTAAALLTNLWQDADGDPCGMAIFGIQSRQVGEWQFRHASDTIWDRLPQDNLPPGFVWLCPPDTRLRFVPFIVYTTNVEPALSFLLWDQSTGLPGDILPTSSSGGYTPFSSASGILQLAIQRWNTASPVVTPSGGTHTLTLVEDAPTNTNTGSTVRDILGARASDADGDTLGGAVTYFYYPLDGVWEYQLPGTTTWELLNQGPPTQYLLLAPDARIRFRPDPNWNGTVPLPLHLNAWDQSYGRSGELISPLLFPVAPAKPVSIGYVQVYAQVTPQPDPPVITDNATFAIQFELDGLTGGSARIASLLNGQVSDPDGDSCGVAILDARNTGGRWQYSDASGGNWNDLPAITTGSRVFCLSPERSLRFVPTTTFAGPLLERDLYFYAWDQTKGGDAQFYDYFRPGGDSGLGHRLAWIDVRKRGLEFLLVGDPGNLADDTGRGSVHYEYQINRTEVSNRDYTSFLNAKAALDSLALYHEYMSDTALGGIDRTGTPGNYVYSARDGRADWPVNGVTWWSAVRFVNWIHNGTGTGDTETGAYLLEGNTSVPSNATTVHRQPEARVHLPSEDEWYKAAYYDPLRQSYWEYGVQADDIPYALLVPPPGAAGSANLLFANDGHFSPCGAYLHSFSPCGAKDMAGNVREWTDSRGPSWFLLRDSAVGLPPIGAAASRPASVASTETDLRFGFRLAAPALYTHNAAPVLTEAGQPVLAHSLGPNNGTPVRELLQAIGRDLDSVALGIAVTGVDRQHGQWQFGTLNPQTSEITWQDVGHPDPTHALLLAPSHIIRFLPHPGEVAAGWLPGLSFRAWDRTSGQAGDTADTTQSGAETAFSARVKTAYGRCDLRQVEHPGNAPDDTGHGAVAYSFTLSAYEVSNRDYVAFLNAKAADNNLGLFQETMSDSVCGGIDQAGSAGSYTYSIRPGREDWPVIGVSWYAAIRYANWVHHGRHQGDTESGAYTLLGGTELPANHLSIAREPHARAFLPTEDEWYKAAYFDPATGLYWEYAVRTNAAPIQEPPPGGPFSANLAFANYAPSSVGAYASATSCFLAHDMAGNTREWLENRRPSGIGHRFRGGAYGYPPLQGAASYNDGQSSQEILHDLHTGFRLAGPQTPPPDPTTIEVPASPDPSGHLRLRWLGRPGDLYQLQAIDNLSHSSDPAAWENLGDPLPGAGLPLDLNLQPEPPAQHPSRFYRLLVLPR